MKSCMISLMISQVADAEAALKMKIRPVNAFFKCYNFAYLSGLPREELHQFLVGLYGEYIVCFPPDTLGACASQSSSSAAQTRVSTNIWWAMTCSKEFGYASWIVYPRWIRRHRSLKWPPNMQPISTTIMLRGTQGNILLVIGSVSCSWTFLFCFATWLLQRWCAPHVIS